MRGELGVKQKHWLIRYVLLEKGVAFDRLSLDLAYVRERRNVKVRLLDGRVTLVIWVFGYLTQYPGPAHLTEKGRAVSQWHWQKPSFTSLQVATHVLESNRRCNKQSLVLENYPKSSYNSREKGQLGNPGFSRFNFLTCRSLKENHKAWVSN